MAASSNPLIAIFAGDKTVRAYLERVVALAGAQALSETEDPGEATLWIVTGNAQTPPQGNIPVIRLGEGTETGKDVRILKIPLRAASLAEILERTLAQSRQVPAQVAIAEYVLDTAENLWLAPQKPPVRLTEKETAIMLAIKESAPSSLSRPALLTKVWAYADGVETHTLETHIYRLRQKIEEDPSKPSILLTDEDGYRLKD